MPSFEEREEMWRTLDFQVHDVAFPQVAAYLASLKFEATLHRVFRLPIHPVLDLYLSSRQFYQSGLFEHFWNAPSVASNLPFALSESPPTSDTVFRWESPFLLSGSLAAVWAFGGIYGSGWCSRDAGEAKTISEAAANELLVSDYTQTHLFTSHSPWCSFFCDVAFDYTWIVIQLSQRLIHVVLATDTD